MRKAAVDPCRHMPNARSKGENHRNIIGPMGATENLESHCVRDFDVIWLLMIPVMWAGLLQEPECDPQLRVPEVELVAGNFGTNRVPFPPRQTQRTHIYRPAVEKRLQRLGRTWMENGDSKRF
jgi:hypothetical protein